MAFFLFSCGGEQASSTASDIVTDTVTSVTPPQEAPPESEDMQLRNVAAHMLGGFLIKSAKYNEGNVQIQYAANLKEVNVNGDHNLSPDEYWKSGKRIEKYFPMTAFNLMNEMASIKSVEVMIPFEGKTHHMTIDRKAFEAYVGHSFDDLKKNPHEMFHYKHVRNIEGRKKFADKFVTAK